MSTKEEMMKFIGQKNICIQYGEIKKLSKKRRESITRPIREIFIRKYYKITAVIPDPIAYINVVAVKKLIVGS